MAAFLPIIPAALEREDAGITLLGEFERKTCARAFILSGAIKDNGLVLGVFGVPPLEVAVVFPQGALDLVPAE